MRTRVSGALIAVLTGTVTNAQNTPPAVGVNPGAPIWNGSTLFNDALADDIAAAGCRFVRINFRIDGNASWTPAHLAAYDNIVQNAAERNLRVIGIILYETVPGSQADWNENYNTTGRNAYTTAFAETAWLLIDRYKDDIKLFEIWNEPDCWSVPPASNPLNPGCFYIWPRIFANLLAETYKECIEQGGATFFDDHDVSLVTAGLFAHDIGGSFSTSRAYMTDVYNQTDVWDAFESDPLNPGGRRYPWDYFGYHFYLNQGGAVSTSELANYFNDIRAMRGIYGDATPIIVTEFGWNTQGVTLEQQADNLRSAYDWLRAQADVAAAMWYQWNNGDGGWGLVYSVGNPKPSYYEFAAQCGVVDPPAPAFTATPQSGVAPLGVQFFDQTTGLVDTWAWDFGDGGGAGTAEPVHIYDQPGVYTVELTATGPGGSATVTEPGYIVVASPADLDGDGDGDLHDYAVMQQCGHAAGGPIPSGCAVASGAVAAPVGAHELAGSLGALSSAISGSDALHGNPGSAEAGGFHAATPGGTAGGLADLVDGVAGSGLEAVLADFANPSLVVRYDLTGPIDLGEVRVFAANSDGRVFQHYDVEVRRAGEPDFAPLIAGVRTGAYGQNNPGTWGASLTQVRPAGPGPLALDVVGLRLRFYPVTNVDGTFLDPGAAYVGSLVKEVDVFAYTGPPIERSVSDLDGDGDSDGADLAIFAEYAGAPQ